MRKFSRFLCKIALLIWVALQAVAATEAQLGQVPLVTGQILIDGQLDEAEWLDALRVELSFEVEPGENIAAPVSTTAYIMEDGKGLLIAFDAKDPDASQIRAFLSDRDNIRASDRVAVKIDAFNASRTAFEFMANPRGIQSDRSIDERTRTDDDSWDAIWQSAGRVTSSGYQVEMYIPYKALRFKDSKLDKDWRIELVRYWPRTNLHKMSNLPFDRNRGCELCQMGAVSGFATAKAPNNLTLIPALTLVQSDTRQINPLTSWENGDIDTRASLDLRWGINQNNYLNATINPDFSQVEADAIQLDINNLSTVFLTEKRAFFLDGADYFNNWSRLVYTRIFEEPEYGVKFTGKTGNHSYGLMQIEDKFTNFLITDEYGASLVRLENKNSQNQVFRYRYDLGDTGNLGTTITHRTATGYESTLFALDGKFWFGEQDFLKFQALSSDSDYPDEVLSRDDVDEENIAGEAISLNYTHLGRNWNWYATYHRFDENVRADAGFVSFSNWERKVLGADYTWYPQNSDSWWQEINISGDRFVSNEIDGTDIDDVLRGEFSISANYQTEFGIYVEDTVQTFIDEGQIQPQTEFDIFLTEVWFEIQPVAAFEFEIAYLEGDEIDFSRSLPGKVSELTTELELQLTDHFSAEVEYINQQLEVDKVQVFDIDLINLRMAYQINEKSFIRLTLQSQSLELESGTADDDVLASQVIYSYKVNPFTLFYLGYSDEYLTEISTRDLERSEKTLFMKFSYAWQL